MKKILAYLSVALLCLTASCNDMMDLPSDGRTSLDEIFAQRNGVKGYLNSCYGYCPGPYMDRASLTDEAQDADDITGGSRYAAWYADAVSSSNFSACSTDGSPWASLYQGIRHCNVFLERIRTVDPETIQSTPDEIGGWTAQAHVLRALYYLQLIKRYGGVPLLKNSYEADHDYSADSRASFSEVVRFIVEDCRAALEYDEEAFGYGIPDMSFGIVTRSVPYAIMSQAVTYAASPLWSDGSYTWEDAERISAEALHTLLSNDYSLFSRQPQPDIAQNPYALYFITSSDDRRSTDKETIYQAGGNMAVWQQAGMPSTAGMIKSGPCPSQELVDCYETSDGVPVLDPASPYRDEQHLQPNYNAANRLYDPANPYANRDPRFYASIYYNGAERTLGLAGARDDDFLCQIVGYNGLASIVQGEDRGEPFYGVVTADKNDPYVYCKPGDLDIDWDTDVTITFSFLQRHGEELINTGMYFVVGGAIDPSIHLSLGTIAPTTVGSDEGGRLWDEYRVDLTEIIRENFRDTWNAESYVRFDFNKDQPYARYVEFKHFKINVTVRPEEGSEPVYVETFVGGKDGISVNDRRSTRTGYYLRKFNNWQSNVNNNADGAIRLFRLAEIYLNFAEAAYQAYGPDAPRPVGAVTASARDAVNFVRRRAGMPDLPAGLSREEFELRYRNERRVELAFEEHRYFDVRRWKLLDRTDRCVTGMRITPQGERGFSYERIAFPRSSWREKYYLYPIDQDEVNKMQELTGADWQNPGWL